MARAEVKLRLKYLMHYDLQNKDTDKTPSIVHTHIDNV